MIASVGFLRALVLLATIVATAAPIVLVMLFLRDWRRGRLW